MGYSTFVFAESGAYGKIRHSGTQVDICYGPINDNESRGHVVIVDGKVIFVRPAIGIPAACQTGQTVLISGLNPIVSGGNLLLLAGSE